MLGNFVFSETGPAAAGTAASSKPVQNAASYLAAGIAGPLDDFDAVDVVAEITGGTGGTIDVYVQTSSDGGANWYDIIHFPQVAGGAGPTFSRAPLSLSTATANAVVVGKNLTPALTTSPGVVNGAFTDRCRLVMVAGAGTSVGATVVVRMAPQRHRTREHGTVE
jgi:hypothetical protein